MLNGVPSPVKGGTGGPSQCRALSSGILRKGLTGGESKDFSPIRNRRKTASGDGEAAGSSETKSTVSLTSMAEVTTLRRHAGSQAAHDT
jgi:hypothetical protein